MNNARRKTIESLLNQISSLKEEIEAVTSNEQDAFDSMPESLQQSDRGQASESAIGSLENASNQLDDVMGELSEAMA
ncbi:hypothetical protein RU07_21835 [Agrobacterium tumefaciens]|uniref:Uncharacterized protein n=1 Tax=Agrobacterium tumefaciens TaxID=358 RepID=A0A0D0KML4_AGRTU|nr:hypothetical protein RU07_21835 [Agrobacterium tumefaciens]